MSSVYLNMSSVYKTRRHHCTKHCVPRNSDRNSRLVVISE